MVVELLTLRGLGPEQRAAGEAQVGSALVHLLGDQEVLLLGSHRGDHALDLVVAEQAQDAQRLAVERLHRAQKRRLLVEGVAGVGAKRRRNAQRRALDERVARGIPRGVAAGLEGGAQTARGKRRCVRLAFHQLLARELHDHAAVGGRRDEAVMLLGRDSRERLEPMRVVGRPARDRPVLHGGGHRVRHAQIETGPLVDGLPQRPVDFRGKRRLHGTVVEHQASEFLWNVHVGTSFPFD